MFEFYNSMIANRPEFSHRLLLLSIRDGRVLAVPWIFVDFSISPSLALSLTSAAAAGGLLTAGCRERSSIVDLEAQEI